MIDLKNIILEKLSETWLFEMSFSRQEYINKLTDISPQIVENWCLIKYCNMYDEENYNRLHWSNELLTHMENIRKKQLKSGLNKLNTTIWGLYEKDELNNIDTVDEWLDIKWSKEQLPLDTRRIIAGEFVKELPKICELLSCKSPSKLKNYIYNEI